jgi:hypothetical protein
VNGYGKDGRMHSAGETQIDDAYLPLKELSRYAGFSVRRLRDSVSDPVAPLPCYRIGGRVLVKRSEYDTWAQRFRRVSSGTLDALVDNLMKDIS